MDLNLEEILNRLRIHMNLKHEKDLADFLDMSPQTLATTKKRGSIPYKKIIEKSVNNYNLEYLFLGKGRSVPPKLDLENDEDIDFDFLQLMKNYMPLKMKEEIKERLLKIKELQV